MEEIQKAWGKVVARAWSDEAFKKQLLANPIEVLKANGVDLPPEVAVKVVEDSAKVIHLILPNKPTDLSDEELDQVAGGALVSGLIAGKIDSKQNLSLDIAQKDFTANIAVKI
jgi:hypothetical protein